MKTRTNPITSSFRDASESEVHINVVKDLESEIEERKVLEKSLQDALAEMKAEQEVIVTFNPYLQHTIFSKQTHSHYAMTGMRRGFQSQPTFLNDSVCSKKDLKFLTCHKIYDSGSTGGPQGGGEEEKFEDGES